MAGHEDLRELDEESEAAFVAGDLQRSWALREELATAVGKELEIQAEEPSESKEE